MSTTDNLEARALLERAAKVLERTSNDTLDGRNAAIDIRDFLARSLAPTPAKELSDEEIERVADNSTSWQHVWGSGMGSVPASPQEKEIIRKTLRYARDNGYVAPAPPPSGAVVEDRNAECVKAWPECEPMAFDPRCCRFPKSCSCTSGSIAAVASSPSVDRVASLGLVEDARAVLNRWDSPQWEWDKHGHTAGLMANLRKSVESAPSVDEQVERIMGCVEPVVKDYIDPVWGPNEIRTMDRMIRNRIKALLASS